MSDGRASLGFDDEFDISELIEPQQSQSTEDQNETLKKKLAKGGQQFGFVSREVPRRRKVSPYTAQFGGKCRPAVKALFKEIGDRLGCYDTETLERAILALIEKEGMDDLRVQYEELIKR